MYALNLLERKVGEKRREVGKEGEPIQGCIIKLAATGMFRKLYNQNLKVIHRRTEGRAFIHMHPSPIGLRFSPRSFNSALWVCTRMDTRWNPGHQPEARHGQLGPHDHMRSGKRVLSWKETGKWCRSGVWSNALSTLSATTRLFKTQDQKTVNIV